MYATLSESYAALDKRFQDLLNQEESDSARADLAVKRLELFLLAPRFGVEENPVARVKEARAFVDQVVDRNERDYLRRILVNAALRFDPSPALDEIIEADSDFDMSKYDKTIIDSARTYGGKIAYMPRSFDQITLFINVSLFKKIGLENEVPTKAKYGDNWENWTWDACLELLAKIRTALDTKYGKSSKNYYPLAADLFWNPVYNCIVRSFGGNCVDVENMDTGFNPENPAYAQTVKAFDFMNKLVSEKYSPAGQGQFTNGFEAMWIGTRPSVTGVVSDGKIEVAFAPLPKFTDSITGLTDTETFVSFGSSGYALNSNSKNKTLAWEFIKFTASEEGQKIIASAGSCVPIISSQLTADGDWTKVEGLENVDQSAFIFRGNTLIPATYARGINIKNEFAVYTDSKNEIANNLGKTTDAAVIVKKLYDATKAYIKK